MKPQYYKSTYTFPQYASAPPRISFLTSFQPNIEIEVSDACEGGGDMNVHIKREAEYDLTPPQEFYSYKVRKTTKEQFEKTYNEVWKQIDSDLYKDSEIYVLSNYKGSFDIYAFTNDKVEKRRCCHMHASMSDDWFSCSITSNRSFRQRPQARKKGEAISYEVFLKIKLLTLDYFRDKSSLKVLMDQYWEMATRLLEKEDEPLEPLRNVIDYSDIVTQISKRKESLTNQLIEEDGTREERLKIRSEIKGLDYALKVIALKGQQ